MQRPLKKTIEIVNAISPSFCAAKWYNATIWLGNGRTASCHLPPAHSIPLESIASNPSALHNTVYKKQKRKEMLDGVRCDECAYCWTVEDKRDTEVYSDRAYKSHVYSEKDINLLKEIGLTDVDPKTLEISFDNLCNLSCSYCNAEFSSTWSTDIKENGLYPTINTPGGGTFRNAGEHALPFGNKNENNPYVDAFFKWFHAGLKDNLTELRVTGGEPTRSPWFWKLLDECENTKFDFAVNSNLIMDQARMNKLIQSSKKFKTFDLYTSCESYGEHAEFVRSGLDYEQWRNNLVQFSNDGHYRMIHIMMTISALSIWTITEFMSDILELRKHSRSRQFHMSVNILRYPSFQNINVLPEELKLSQATKISDWLNTASGLSEFERNQIERLVTYLKTVDRSYEDTDSQENKLKDFAAFTKEYAARRNKNISTVFPTEFNNWFITL
jgi:organic radical activating enzyme